MERWLCELHDTGEWKLNCKRPTTMTLGKLASDGIHPVLEVLAFIRHLRVIFPMNSLKILEPTTISSTKLTGWGVGASGKFYDASNQEGLSTWGFEPQHADVDPDKTYVWGNSPSGDMLRTMDSRGGWFSVSSNKVHLHQLGVCRNYPATVSRVGLPFMVKTTFFLYAMSLPIKSSMTGSK